MFLHLNYEKSFIFTLSRIKKPLPEDRNDYELFEGHIIVMYKMKF